MAKKHQKHQATDSKNGHDATHQAVLMLVVLASIPLRCKACHMTPICMVFLFFAGSLLCIGVGLVMAASGLGVL